MLQIRPSLRPRPGLWSIHAGRPSSHPRTSPALCALWSAVTASSQSGHLFFCFRSLSSSSSSVSDPAPPHVRRRSLNVLFCGSDEFSIPSLEALAALTRPPNPPSLPLPSSPSPSSSSSSTGTTAATPPPPLISRITVLCRSPKGFWRHHRGTRKRHVPVEEVAKKLGLQTYYADTPDDLAPLPTADAVIEERGGQGEGGGEDEVEGRGRGQDAKATAGWKRCRYDLIVASSFGLKIPARMIHDSTFGGVNVHPSMLPDLKGSSPLQHTLLLHRPFSGLTIQTLHPTKIDAGEILDQTPYPGLPIDAETTSLDQLTHRLSILGGEMLGNCVKEGLYLLPLRGGDGTDQRNGSDITSSGEDGIVQTRGWASDPEKVRHFANTIGPVARAPKLTIDHRQLRWREWSSVDILTRHRVLGDLWDLETYERCRRGGGGNGGGNIPVDLDGQASDVLTEAKDLSEEPVRVLFHGWDILRRPDDAGRDRPGMVQDQRGSVPTTPGTPFLVRDPSQSRKRPILAFPTVDGGIVTPTSATIEYRKTGVGLIKLVEMMELAGVKPVTFRSDDSS